MFLKILQYSEKNTCVESLFNKVAGLKAYKFIKKRLWQRCFLVNIVKLLKTAFFIEHLCWLLLDFLQTCWKQLWRKSFLGRVFLRNFFRNYFLVFAATSLKITPLQVFQFLSFLKHVRGASRIQSNIKMEPIAKIVNGSRG